MALAPAASFKRSYRKRPGSNSRAPIRHTRRGASDKSLAFIEQVENLLFGDARARDIKNVVIGEFYNLSDALPGLSRRFRLPFA